MNPGSWKAATHDFNPVLVSDGEILAVDVLMMVVNRRVITCISAGVFPVVDGYRKI